MNMKIYLLLLRGINLGNDNKVSMPILREQLETIGLEEVSSYISTGNLFFSSNCLYDDLVSQIATLLSSYYDFAIPFTLINMEELLEEGQNLPDWWQDETAYRRDALFYLPPITKEVVANLISTWPLTEGENYHLGDKALYWLAPTKEEYRKTAHAKKIMAKPFNQMVTLRNANTTMTLIDLMREKIKK
ncbi:DUF1697 domain-containing protein [Streptococcus ovis]|uniref:DUF1697 domain-containing protein n=1 Tax=Streptococcus ovis TaxID=82806 RepID=UPI000361109B|nr:DUF1697 domain-containing protein [Streptococcus ovis]